MQLHSPVLISSCKQQHFINLFIYPKLTFQKGKHLNMLVRQTSPCGFKMSFLKLNSLSTAAFEAKGALNLINRYFSETSLKKLPSMLFDGFAARKAYTRFVASVFWFSFFKLTSKKFIMDIGVFINLLVSVTAGSFQISICCIKKVCHHLLHFSFHFYKFIKVTVPANITEIERGKQKPIKIVYLQSMT